MRVMFLAALPLLVTIAWTSPVHAVTRTVPSPHATVQAAINASSSGDVIEITTANGGTPYAPFTVDRAVIVTKSSNVTDEVFIAGNGSVPAAVITSSGGTVQSLTLQGGTGFVADVGPGTVRLCRILDNGTVYSDAVARLTSGGRLLNCHVELSSGEARAVSIESSGSGSTTRVEGNRIEVDADSPLTYLDVIRAAGTYMSILQDTLIVTGAGAAEANGIQLLSGTTNASVIGNWVSGVNYGILVSSGTGNGSHMIRNNIVEDCIMGIRLATGSASTVRTNTVVRTSADNCSLVTTTGIRIGPSYGSSTIDRNLMVNMTRGLYTPLSVPGGTSITKNLYWHPGCGVSCEGITTDSTQVKVRDVIFSGAHDATVDIYTHRIDSPAAPGNNSFDEKIGAMGVESAWDTLEYNARLLGGETVRVLEDVMVPEGTRLALEAGSSMLADEEDESNRSGFPADAELIELTVHGYLDVNGTDEDPVYLGVSEGVEEWWGIMGKDPATLSISGAVIEDAEYPVASFSPEPLVIDGCHFDNPPATEYSDLYLYGPGHRTITNNTFVDPPLGAMELLSSVSDSTFGSIIGNQVTWTGATSAIFGIRMNIGPSDFVVEDNVVDGCSGGIGIHAAVVGTARLTNNTVTDCRYGVVRGRGAVSIGESGLSGASGGSITGNGIGLVDSCAGMGSPCSGSCPTMYVRKTLIADNTLNIRVAAKGRINLGTDSTDAGGNSLYGSTGSGASCFQNASACTSSTTLAYGNWWGSACSGPSPSCVSGALDASGPLCSDPLDAVREIDTEAAPPIPALAFTGRDVELMSGRGNLYFAVDRPGHLQVDLFAVTGQRIGRLLESDVAAGTIPVTVRGASASGRLTAGLYFVRAVLMGEMTVTSKLVVVR